MNRRRFLKWLGVGVTAGVVAPAALSKGTSALPRGFRSSVGAKPYVDALKEKRCASIAPYNEYASFSEFSRTNALDQIVSNTASELGKKAAEEINQLYAGI